MKDSLHKILAVLDEEVTRNPELARQIAASLDIPKVPEWAEVALIRVALAGISVLLDRAGGS